MNRNLIVLMICAILCLTPTLMSGCDTGGGGGGGCSKLCDIKRAGHTVSINCQNGGSREATADAKGCVTIPADCGCDSSILDPLASASTGQLTADWYAQGNDMYHDTGEPDSYGDSGWTGTAGQDGGGWLLYGPYWGTNVSVGNHLAGWSLMIDNIWADNAQQVYLDVLDLTTNTILGAANVTRDEWENEYDYETFGVPFTVTSDMISHQLQFRCLWYGQATVTVGACGVAEIH